MGWPGDKTMHFEPLHDELGAQVFGFDLQTGGTPAEVAALRNAWDRHGLLLFRGDGPISHERHVEIASWFGPPPPVDNSGRGDFVSVLKNSDAAGTVELEFHSDLTYTEDPIRAICLHAIAVPEGGTSTNFVSGVSAWKRLPEDMKARLDGLTLEHRLDHFASGFDWPVFVAEHPVRLDHPRTGAPVLFVTQSHARRILELDQEESDALIERLFAHLYAPEHVYEHHWQLHDLVLIDNLALQHARPQRADPGRGERALQRVALADTTLDVLVERARAREAAA